MVKVKKILTIKIVSIFISITLLPLNLVYPKDSSYLRIPMTTERKSLEKRSPMAYPEWLRQAGIYAAKIATHNADDFIKSLRELEEPETQEKSHGKLKSDMDIYLYPDPDIWEEKYWPIIQEIRNSDLSDSEKVVIGKFISRYRDFIPHLGKVSPEDLRRILDVLDTLKLERLKSKAPKLCKLLETTIKKIGNELTFFSKHSLTREHMKIVRGRLELFNEYLSSFTKAIESYLSELEVGPVDEERLDLVLNGFYNYSVEIGYIVAIANDGYPFTETMVEKLRKSEQLLQNNKFTEVVEKSKYKKLVNYTKFKVTILLSGLREKSGIYVCSEDLNGILKAYETMSNNL